MQTITAVPVLPPRPIDGHKGTFGKVLVTAGSMGYSGAAALTGRSALRGGAGLVRVAVPRSMRWPYCCRTWPTTTSSPWARVWGRGGGPGICWPRSFADRS